MNLEDIWKTITTDFLNIVGLALALALFYSLKYFKSLLKKWIGNFKWTSTKQNNDFKKIIDNDSFIKQKLHEMRIISGADRAWIVRFHNGLSYAYENYHSYFYSCSHESVTIGMDHYYNIIQRVPVSRYPNHIKRLFEERIVIVNDTNEDFDGEYQVYDFQFGIKSMLLGVLCNEKENIIGFYVLAFTDEKSGINKIIEGDETYQAFQMFGDNIKYSF